MRPPLPRSPDRASRQLPTRSRDFITLSSEQLGDDVYVYGRIADGKCGC